MVTTYNATPFNVWEWPWAWIGLAITIIVAGLLTWAIVYSHRRSTRWSKAEDLPFKIYMSVMGTALVFMLVWGAPVLSADYGWRYDQYDNALRDAGYLAPDIEDGEWVAVKDNEERTGTVSMEPDNTVIVTDLTDVLPVR